MMRSVEIVLVIFILTGAFIVASSFAVLPEPRQASPVNLRRLALTTLQMLDSNHELSKAAFSAVDDPSWSELQVALSASLPPDVVYNLTVYEVDSSGSGASLYTPFNHVSNAESLGVSSDASSYFVASSNVTFTFTPEKIGGTLYMLNCSDANGWWITGYTAQSLAEDLYKLLSPYFVKTVVVQNTAQLGQILGNSSLQGELVQNAVVINTFGEAVPIPTAYCKTPYSDNSYARYCYFLGEKVRLYNWTWASIVGYPFYYVTNTGNFTNDKNDYGIYGMKDVRQPGMYAFLQGLTNITYSASDSSNIFQSVGVVSLSSQVLDNCNYYGIYPSPNQTSTRAIQKSKLTTYPNLTVGLLIFDEKSGCYPGALYNHWNGTRIEGSLLALGLTRTPDIRLTAIGLLSYYKPKLYPSEYTAYGTSRLVVLQLGLVGGG